MTDNPRKVVIEILMRVFKDDVYSHTAIREALDRHPDFSRSERSFVKLVSEGTIERVIELDYIIDKYASVKVDKMKPAIRNILRSALYQMKYVNSVPAEAACNEAVKIAQSMGFYNLKGFVNGVLRSISRNLKNIPYPSKDNINEYFSVRYSMPLWIVEGLTGEYGEDTTEKILRRFLTPSPLTVRLSMREDVRQRTLDSLRKQEIEVSAAPYLDYAFNLKKTSSITSLPEFQEGLLYVQDVSSMLAAEISGVSPGDYVIDMCAAPGGKSLHIADMMNGYGMVEARDVTEEKVNLIRQNINRTNMINIKAVKMDGTVFDKVSKEKGDIVICDVPCSGLGVIGRKPDIKYRLRQESIDELIFLQRMIMHNAASYVRPGGVLIYSTCTIEGRENLDNVKWFCENYPFETESIDRYLPEELRSDTTSEGYLQLIPGIHECDGFFMARIRKKK